MNKHSPQEITEMVARWTSLLKTGKPLEPEENQLRVDARHSCQPEIRSAGISKLQRMCDELDMWIDDELLKLPYKTSHKNVRKFSTKMFYQRISVNERYLMSDGKWLVDYLFSKRPSPQYFGEPELIYSIALTANLSDIDLTSIPKQENLDSSAVDEKPKSIWDSISENAYEPKKPDQ